MSDIEATDKAQTVPSCYFHIMTLNNNENKHMNKKGGCYDQTQRGEGKMGHSGVNKPDTCDGSTVDHLVENGLAARKFK